MFNVELLLRVAYRSTEDVLTIWALERTCGRRVDLPHSFFFKFNLKQRTGAPSFERGSEQNNTECYYTTQDFLSRSIRRSMVFGTKIKHMHGPV